MSSAPSASSPSELFLSHKAPLDHSWSSAKCFPGVHATPSSEQTTLMGPNDFFGLQTLADSPSAFFDSAGSFSGLLSSTSWDNALDLPSLNQLDTVYDYARSCAPSDLELSEPHFETFGDNLIAGRSDSRDAYWPSSVLPQLFQQGLATDVLVSSFDPFHPMMVQQSQSAFSGHISNVSGYQEFDRFSSLKKVLDLDDWNSFGHHPSSFRLPDPPSPEESSSRELTPSSASSSIITDDGSDFTSQKTGACRWKTPYGMCNYTLDNHRGTIAHHLVEHHQCNRKKGSNLVKCQWEGCTSNPLQNTAMARHVKTHLGFLSNSCHKCNGIYSRNSSLIRHMEICNGLTRRKTKFCGRVPKSAKEEILGNELKSKRWS
ncbi:hypothetical protein C8J55DRAFT_516790 [Lentinula edodes]|uniref:C2H2-type domain-containing protein n=1 Tax=Lentinula lateritia TaxID=40482 RepID=A0A9W9A7S1_9AGAR|nr:hypothetical protein C8J55DRAFT_516790 [Lentinula edodes]